MNIPALLDMGLWSILQPHMDVASALSLMQTCRTAVERVEFNGFFSASSEPVAREMARCRVAGIPHRAHGAVPCPRDCVVYAQHPFRPWVPFRKVTPVDIPRGLYLSDPASTHVTVMLACADPFRHVVRLLAVRGSIHFIFIDFQDPACDRRVSRQLAVTCGGADGDQLVFTNRTPFPPSTLRFLERILPRLHAHNLPDLHPALFRHPILFPDWSGGVREWHFPCENGGPGQKWTDYMLPSGAEVVSDHVLMCLKKESRKKTYGVVNDM